MSKLAKLKKSKDINNLTWNETCFGLMQKWIILRSFVVGLFDWKKIIFFGPNQISLFLFSLIFVDWPLKLNVIHPAFQEDHEAVPALERQ